jgi:hypothetical protein
MLGSTVVREALRDTYAEYDVPDTTQLDEAPPVFFANYDYIGPDDF